MRDAQVQRLTELIKQRDNEIRILTSKLQREREKGATQPPPPALHPRAAEERLTAVCPSAALCGPALSCLQAIAKVQVSEDQQAAYEKFQRSHTVRASSSHVHSYMITTAALPRL